MKGGRGTASGRECSKHCEGTRPALGFYELLGRGPDVQTESRGALNLLGFVESAARADLEWASMSA